MKTSLYFKNLFTSSTFFLALCLVTFAEAQVIEDVIVTAEKRSESQQEKYQAVTALNEEKIETKNITDYDGISEIAPDVTVAKNEGYKTIMYIRGVGDETNQNGIAAHYKDIHMEGIFIATKCE